jgi:hypothetical protein
VNEALVRARFPWMELPAPEALRESGPLDHRLRQDLTKGHLGPCLIAEGVA